MVTEKEYNSIIEYATKKMLADEHGSYVDWKENRSKKGTDKIPKEIQEGFEKFWSEYPGISRFEYMGKKFEGERVLKANKQVCLKLYNDAIISIMDNWKHIKLSELGATQTLINALQVQIETIKQESYKTGQNRLQYLKSCEVYLRQKAYEPWIGQSMPEPLEQKQDQYTEA